VRRLTHVEYDNTVRDLLGDTSAPGLQFLPDVSEGGFTNNAAGQSVSPALAQQYMVATERLSKAAAADLPRLLGCDPVAGDPGCVPRFITAMGKRAWRRPITQDEQQRLQAVFDAGNLAYGPQVGTEMLLQVLLQAPQFIYRLETSAAPPDAKVVALDPYELATRLSYFLVGSAPDAELFAAADSGAILDSVKSAAEVERLLQTPAARTRLGQFFSEWMRLQKAEFWKKDTKLFPTFGRELALAMRQQVEVFATSVVLDMQGTHRDLLTASFTYVTPELAPLYGVTAPTTNEFTFVELDPNQRAGLLTHVGVLAGLAKANMTDPVHRGKFVREMLLCSIVPPPPPGIVVNPPVISPDATTRQLFAQHQADPVCAGCHQLMDPIGLGFENYDPMGQWRDLDSGMPVDASGEVFGSDIAGPFTGAVELAHKLADSAAVAGCFAEVWFRFAQGRTVSSEDTKTLADLREAFASRNFRLKDLMIEVTQTPAFRFRPVPQAEAL
jgi:hypothetical protein